MFEDVEAFKKIKSEYNEYWVKERKHYIENEASLLDLALSIDGYYEYKNKFEKEGILKPILVWLYWKYREIFEKKIREWFNLGEDQDNQTKNFIRIYLEHDDEDEGVIFTKDGTHIYPVCFAIRQSRN